MLAYHNDPSIKAKYLARVAEQHRQDDILQGYGYWARGKGCAVGCTLHSNKHSQYEIELGLESLARLSFGGGGSGGSAVGAVGQPGGRRRGWLGWGDPDRERVSWSFSDDRNLGPTREGWRSEPLPILIR
jgi:hypothetical protein